jgi:hypothetical protein
LPQSRPWDSGLGIVCGMTWNTCLLPS